MAGILDRIFGNGATPEVMSTPAAAAANAQPAPSQPASAATPDANKTGAMDSPLGDYKDLWQPATNADGSPVVVSNQPLFNVDPAKISEAASKANFAAGLSPELIQQALKGDANAFMQAINQVSQQSFAQATIASTKLIEQALEKHGASQDSKLPGLVKQSMVRDSMQTNPLYKHEATRPLLHALEQQLAVKHPNATAAEITQHAQKFIEQFAAVAQSSSPASKQAAEDAARPSADDWSGF